jgi:hypothetical protein
MNIVGLITGSKNWLIACGVCLMVGFGVGWHEKALRVPALLEAQKKADAKQCETEKQTTRKANDTLQNDRDRIAADLARYKRLHPRSCVIPARQSDVREGGAEYAGGNGVVAGTTDDFRDFAATCERYRSEVMTCINFLAAERAPR